MLTNMEELIYKVNVLHYNYYEICHLLKCILLLAVLVWVNA